MSRASQQKGSVHQSLAIESNRLSKQFNNDLHGKHTKIADLLKKSPTNGSTNVNNGPILDAFQTINNYVNDSID